MKPARLLISLLILCLAYSVCAASVRVNPTGAAKGTFNLCALRDRYGFLWIGTSSGLACFDGNGRPVNNLPQGILRATSNMRVTNIFEYGDDLLLATPDRLMKLDRTAMSVSRMPVKTEYGVEIASQVNNICHGPGKSSDIWIATQGQGLFRYDSKKKKLIQNSRQGSFFTDVILADDGAIYAAEITGKIFRYRPDGEYEASFPIPEYTQNKTMIDLEPDGDRIWISSGVDIYCLDTSTGSIAHMASAPSMISSLIRHDDSHLMLGTASGIMEYDTSAHSLRNMEVAETGHNPGAVDIDVKINQLRKDPASGGTLAVRQSGEILELFALEGKYRFVPIAKENGKNNFVNVLTFDRRSRRLWVGSDFGLYCYDFNTSALSSPSIPGLGKQPVSSVTVDGDRIFIATAADGLFEYNCASGMSRHFRHDEDTPYSLLSDEVSDVFVTTHGEIYVLTHWGICRYNPDSGEFNTLTEVGHRTEVVSMAEYYDGSVWAATLKDGLLCRRQGENRFDRFNSRNLENISVTRLMMGRNGTLFAATQSDGLFYFDRNSHDFERYRLPLLSNRSILSMQEDDSGDLWILTDESIIKISRDGNVDACYRNLLPSIAMTRPFALVDGGGIAIGGNNGFQIIDSYFISGHKDVAAYPTVITFPFEDDSKVIDQLGLSILLYTTDRITLPFDHNSFTIHLAANHSSDIPTVSYDYMLQGIDKDWNIGSSQSEVTYNNLPPGTYSFMVRPSGFTDIETNALTITVSPPWYLSMWAYIGYFVLLMLAAACIWYVVRMTVRRQYARRIESLKIRREREDWESKMRFFVDLVHEIRTPLMLIALPLEQLFNRFKAISSESGVRKSREAFDRELSHGRKYLESMQTNLDYLLGITNELLDFRKVENETEHNLTLSSCNLNLMIEEIRERFEEPMKAEGKRLIVSLPDAPVVADMDKAKIDRVLMNLIGNARKYCRTVTEVKMVQTDGNVVITVSDDGPGIPQEHRAHIFDLYYQIKGDVVAAALGTGLGLAYARLITQSHGGGISVGQSPEGGAMFCLSIPVKKTDAAAYEDVCEMYDDAVRDTADDAQASDGVQATDSADSADDTAEEPCSIMVVDDNKELLEMISDGLTGRYRVVTAVDGIDALEKLKDNDIDFIVSDVMMPRMDGVELLQKVKGNIDTSHIPFIILTARTTRESREEGMEKGADIYLEKPFSMRALIYQIENIRRTRQYFYARRRGTEPLAEVEADEKEAIKENKLPDMSKYDRDFLDRMDSLMAENMSDDMFTIDVLAERMNMSRSSFYRKLKALTGMTPVEYMKNYRLDAAAEMLRNLERVNEVAANVGFSSMSYFAKCFKEKYGVLPRDYVNSQPKA